ncbi:titin-like [Mizuhopecten yessoensis]|uniref:titin-like n=1 Tax=Mizuhopecten yessoensis TaxID=6573 RepID=UPI000B45B6F3|nr:titin-like [Mizuhopecten yessoensis]
MPVPPHQPERRKVSTPKRPRIFTSSEEESSSDLEADLTMSECLIHVSDEEPDEPEIQQIEPELQQIEPDIQGLEPEVQEPEPEIQDLEPEIVEALPEIQETQLGEVHIQPEKESTTIVNEDDENHQETPDTARNEDE